MHKDATFGASAASQCPVAPASCINPAGTQRRCLSHDGSGNTHKAQALSKTQKAV